MKCADIPVCAARDAKRCDMRCELPSTASAGYAHGVVDLDSCAQCDADPATYCTAGRHKAREPHDLDGAWMKCGVCGNMITVIGRQAVKRARLAWNIRA